MKIKSLAVLLTLSLFLLTFGCPVKQPDFPGITSPYVSLEKAMNPDIDVYIDSTPSMSGFAAPGITTSYINLVKDISSSAISMSGLLGKVTYYKFGETITKINQPVYNNAVLSSFYIGTSGNKRTMVAQVLHQIIIQHKMYDAAESEGTNKSTGATKSGNNNKSGVKVSIIITDLFENNSNVDSLIDNVRREFGNNLSIGILGVKSYFDGKVYDVGRDIVGKPYKSKVGDPKTYRPFYVLIVGAPGDVLGFYDILNKLSIKYIPETSRNFELLSLRNQQQYGKMANISFQSTEESSPRIKLDKVWTEKIADDRVVVLKAYLSGRRGTDEIITTNFATYPIPGSRLEWAIKDGSNILNNRQDSLFVPQVKIERFRAGQYVADGDAEKCVTKVTLDIKDGEFITHMMINPYKLQKGTYRIKVDISYAYELLAPIIPMDWNMKDEYDPAFGTKTIYLYNLLEGLYGISCEKQEPFVKAYYYLKIIN